MTDLVFSPVQDSLDEIINQCLHNDKPGGNYHKGDNSYWLQSMVFGTAIDISGVF